VDYAKGGVQEGQTCGLSEVPSVVDDVQDWLSSLQEFGITKVVKFTDLRVSALDAEECFGMIATSKEPG
jgi:hypothetical protein